MGRRPGIHAATKASRRHPAGSGAPGGTQRIAGVKHRRVFVTPNRSSAGASGIQFVVNSAHTPKWSTYALQPCTLYTLLRHAFDYHSMHPGVPLRGHIQCGRPGLVDRCIFRNGASRGHTRNRAPPDLRGPRNDAVRHTYDGEGRGKTVLLR
jgi:hypothetical protein